MRHVFPWRSSHRRATLVGVSAAFSLLALPLATPTQSTTPAAMTPDANSDECTAGVTRYIEQEPAVIEQLGLRDAWQFSRGGVLVAVVDSGVEASNQHLTEVVLPGLDLVGRGDGRTDTYGHGTAIAGQIAARAVQGSGLVGVAPDARILPVRIFIDNQEETVKAGKGPDPLRAAEGIRWAADQGAKVIAVAQSTTQDVPALRAAVEYADSRGALVVASSGNASDNEDEDATALRFPAGYPSVLSVTAVGADGLPSDAVVHGVHVEVAAPGQQVLTTFLNAGDCILAGEAASTSYATGYASGVAALVAAAHPDETPADWEYRILATALRSSRSQREPNLGWGIIAPSDAVNFVNDGRIEGPVNPRYPAPVRQVPPVMPPPDPPTVPVVNPSVAAAGIAGMCVALVVAGFLSARLAELAKKRKTTRRKGR